MEQVPHSPRESGVSRIVGVDKQTEKDLLDFFKDRFESGVQGDLEKEHSPELDEVIGEINVRLKEFLKMYDVESIVIPPTNVHMVDYDKFTPEEVQKMKELREGGNYRPFDQQIFMYREYVEDKKLPFLQTLVHEMLHLNSFLALEKTHPGSIRRGIEVNDEDGQVLSLTPRRMGFRMEGKDGITSYFSGIDEAIINELMMRFDWKYFSQFPALQEELAAREHGVEILYHEQGMDREESRKELAYYTEEGDRTDDAWHIRLPKYTYSDERKQLNGLIDDIYEKNKTDFDSREDVFALFAKAALTGRMLEVARLIEKTKGKGSFRELGKVFGTVK